MINSVASKKFDIFPYRLNWDEHLGALGIVHVVPKERLFSYRSASRDLRETLQVIPNIELRMLWGSFISPDGNYLVFAGSDGSLLFERISTPPFWSHCGRLSSSDGIYFLPDSKRIMNVYSDNEKIYSLPSLEYEEREELGLYGEQCRGVAIHPKGDLIAHSERYAGFSSVVVRKFSDAKFRASTDLTCDEIGLPKWRGDSLYLATEDLFVHLFKLNGGSLDRIYSFDITGNPVVPPTGLSPIDPRRMWCDPVFSSRNSVLAGSCEGEIFEWDLDSGAILCRTQAHAGPVNDMVITSSEPQSLYTCGADSCVNIWSLD